MSFGIPLWLLLLGLSVLIVVLHARRRKELSVSSILLWSSVSSGSSRRPQRRLPPLTLPLLLQLLALFLLVLALARPYFDSRPPEHLVIVLDASMSMHATDLPPSRFAAAGSEALRRLSNLPNSTRVSIIVDDGRPVALAARAGARSARVELERYIARFEEPIDEVAGIAAGPVNWRTTSKLVAGTLFEGERTDILLLTDPTGSAEGKDALESTAADRSVQFFEFRGEEPRNVGFSQVQAVPMDEAGHWRLSGTLVSTGVTGGIVELEALFQPDGSGSSLPWTAVDLEVKDGEPVEFELELEVPGRGLLELRLPDDHLVLDNQARFLLLEEPVTVQVLQIGQDNPPLTRAIQAIGNVEFFRAPSLPDDAAEYDLVVIDRAQVNERPDTNVLWIAGARHRPRSLAPLANPEPSGWRNDHPLAESVDWSRLTVTEALDLSVWQNATILLEARGAPLVQTRMVDGFREVAVAFALDDSNWSSLPEFPLFIAALVRDVEPALGKTVHALDRFYPSESMVGGAVADSAATPGSASGWPLWRWLIVAGLLLIVLDALVAGLGKEHFLRPTALSSDNPAATRYRGTVAAQAITVTFLVLALLAVAAPAPAITRQLIYIVEDPRFLRGEAEEFATRLLAPSSLSKSDIPGGQSGVVLMSGRSRIISGVGYEDATDDLEEGRSGADLESALHLAAGMLAGTEDGRIVVIGGAQPTVGNPLRAVPRLASDDIAVDALFPSTIPAGEAMVEVVEAPDWLHPGQDFQLEAVVYSETRQSALLSIYRDEELLVSRDVILHPGRNRIETEASEDETGSYLYEVEIGSEADRFPENNKAGTYVTVQPQPSVLLVSPQVESALLFADALALQGIEATVTEPLGAPWTLAGWLEHDATVLLNVPASDLHSSQQELLAEWVTEHGGGLLLLGGQNSFGPGGYYQTALEKLSPLSSQVPREAPAAAMLFVLDRSGSMQQKVGESTRMQIVKEATIEAIELLGEESETGVVVFDSEATLLAPMQTVENKETIFQQLQSLVASGGTAIQPALELALEEMSDVDASTRHIVLMTDGLSQQGQFDAIMDSFEELEITVSSVAIGSGADTALLQQIARSGGGTFHRTTDFRALPSILAQEALLLSGKPIEETTFRPEWADREAEFLDGMPDLLPPLHGFVLTTLKPSAAVHLLAPEGDPVLASWRYGLGHVLAFTSHPAGTWARDWLAMPEFPLLWAQSVRWVIPRVTGPGLTLQLRQVGDEIGLSVDAIGSEGKPLTDLVLQAELTAEGEDSPTRVSLSEIAPGRYSGLAELRAPATYRISVGPQAENQELEPVTRLFHASYPARYAFSRQDAGTLTEISESTGGQLLFTVEESGLADTSGRWRILQTWPLWLLSGLAMFMASLFLRYRPMKLRRAFKVRSA